VRESDIAPIWNALETTVLAFAVFGVFQSIFLPDFGLTLFPESRAYIDIDPQGHRLVSTLLEPNIAAALILTVLLVQVAQLAAGAPVKRWKPALLLLALILTLSRSGMAGFVFGVLVILAARGLGKRMLRFLGAAFVAILASMPWLLPFARQYAKLDIMGGSGFAARLISWQRAIAVLLESPWYGVGFNTFGFVQEHRGFERMGSSSYSAEGGLLFVAVMTGVIGLLVYVTTLCLVIRQCRSVWRNASATPDERGLAMGAAAVTVAIVVHSFFVNSLFVPFVMEPVFVLWGLGFVIAKNLRQRRLAARAAGSL
jgi:O-antigen ligase